MIRSFPHALDRGRNIRLTVEHAKMERVHGRTMLLELVSWDELHLVRCGGSAREMGRIRLATDLVSICRDILNNRQLGNGAATSFLLLSSTLKHNLLVGRDGMTQVEHVGHQEND